MRKAKKYLLLIQIGVTAGLLSWVLAGIDWLPLFGLFGAIDAWQLFFVFVLVNACYLLQGCRLYLLLPELRSSLKFIPYLYNFWLSSFHDVYVPGKLGGDISRFFYIKKTSSGGGLLIPFIVFRMQGAGLLCFTAMLLIADKLFAPNFFVLFSAAFFFAIVCWLSVKKIMTNKTVTNKLEFSPKLASFRKSAAILFGNTKLLLTTSALYIVFLVFSMSVYCVTALSMNIKLPFDKLLIGVPVIMFAAMIPVSLQGRGITEFLATLFWGSYISSEQVLAICLCIFGCTLAMQLLAWLFWGCGNLYHYISTHPQNNI